MMKIHTRFEPTTVMAAISQHNQHIGLFATATTTYEQPYLLAPSSPRSSTSAAAVRSGTS